jgi:hypothetical protein
MAQVVVSLGSSGTDGRVGEVRRQGARDCAWDNRGVAFVDDRWAYLGIPKGGLPKCTAAANGCLKHS